MTRNLQICVSFASTGEGCTVALIPVRIVMTMSGTPRRHYPRTDCGGGGDTEFPTLMVR